MKLVLLHRAIKLNRERKYRKGWQKAASVLAAVVVFCTTYALILPAITMERNAECGLEVHEHGEACYAQQVVRLVRCGFEIPEGAAVAHSHDSVCYDSEGALWCQLPEAAEHVHSDDCYEVREIACGLAEEEGHICTDECVTEESVQICGIADMTVHQHSADCVTESEQTHQVLTCQLPEHIHEDACYPLEVEDAAGSTYLCGSGEHTHGEACVDAGGNVTCTIPEHIHEAACLVANLDLTADVETAADWEKTLKDVALTGSWPKDVLAVAESQLGYRESVKNCILENGDLKGYTRYGAWYGIPYGDWCAMFASFCLDYAGVEDFPLESRCTRWIEALEAEGLYAEAGTYEPKPGDLIFFDYDLRKDAQAEIEADHVGLVAELIPAEETAKAQIRTIEGNANDKVDYVTYDLDDAAIIGYGKLPESPLTEEQWAQAQEVSAMLAALPAAGDAQTALETLNGDGDKAGYEALRQELIARLETVFKAYEMLNDLQKERITGLDRAEALQTLCGGAAWKEFPALTDDGAVISQLAAAGTKVLSSARAAAEEEQLENTVINGDVVLYHFTAVAESYYTDLQYGEAAVKVELVLPLTAEQAVFDTAAMDWLENAVLNTEVRTINEVETECQVLTGFKYLRSGADSGIAVPCSITETVCVKVLDMAIGEEVAVMISAAMEHGTWEGVCAAHETVEKLTIATDVFTVRASGIDEEHSVIYEGFAARIEEAAALDVSQEEKTALAEQIMAEAVEAYLNGQLTAQELDELGDQLRGLMQLVAEYATGIRWMLQRTAGAVGTMTSIYSAKEYVNVTRTAAVPPVVYSTVFPSSVQIDREGGDNTSADGQVYVSKTIEGTDQENVFDITLNVITKTAIEEVYKDPDTGIVIVLDISNTMNSGFESESSQVSRYDAAISAASDFLNLYAEYTQGRSQVGLVAFNTGATKIFDMSSCSSAAEASSLISTMKTKTSSIIKSYSSDDRDRFTNMEAGLKMAYDMLETVDNQNKYIIFLTDGFPTTYIRSGYDGWDPYNDTTTKYSYNSNRTNRNVYGTSMFYDNVLKRYCTYGTSYSDPGAIKARTMATTIKNAGVEIFSVGVDVGGQSVSYYVSYSDGKAYSVVDRRGTSFEIYDYDSDSKTTGGGSDDFMDWLGGSSTDNSFGIGSGYYYDCSKSGDMLAAFKDIFEQIKAMNASSAHLDWITTDPMGDMGVHEMDSVEFIGFYDLGGSLQNALTGQSGNGPEYENTATFDTAESTIHWDLKNSGYVGVDYGEGTTVYSCTLKYRVRLMNEKAAFVENYVYNTNDVTALTYRIIEVKDGVTSVSEQRSIEFPIPAVHGFVSELKFLKTDPVGTALPGAVFTLVHDTESCGYCRGDGVGYVTIEDMVQTSDGDGIVNFANVPSGHHYTLTETSAPDGYIATEQVYQVVVAYDKLTIDGEEIDPDWSIENDMYYELPHTGGMGTTSHYAFGGLLILAAALMYSCKFGHKRRKGGR